MDKPNNSQKDGSEQSYCNKLINDSKNTIYQITTLMLKESGFGLIIRVIFVIIESIQIIHFCFRDPIKYLWKQKNFVDVVSQITGYSLITPGLNESTWGVFTGVFYFCFAIVLLINVLFFIIATMVQKKDAVITWPISILKVVTELLTSIFFLPFFDVFMQVYNCNSKTNQHNIFTDQKCYEGSYISFAIIGGLSAFLMLSYSSIMVLINFECRFDSSNSNTKISARGDFVFLVYKALLSIGFVLMNNVDYEVILVILIVFFSFGLFSYYSFNIFYLNNIMSKLITAQHASGMWVAQLLILALITKDYAFDAAPYIYLAGFPFIIFIVLARIKQKFSLLLINSNNYESLPIAISQLTYLTKLLGQYKYNKQIAILLDGFLDYHRTLCNKEECPSKRRLMKNTKFTKQLRAEKESETLITLIGVINGMYYYGLQKYPNSTRLRILFALFLLDKMRSKQQALQELLNAEQERPSFDEQFIIYRYKNMIESQLMDNQNEGIGGKQSQNEMVNEISIQNHMAQCRYHIERSANTHVEFWSQLKEDVPDLGKLSELGYKISIINNLADEQRRKLQLMNSNVPSQMRLYAKYYIQILNDKEGGQKVLNELVESLQNTGQKQGGILDVATEALPTIFISVEDDSFGLIYNLNLTAAGGLLGYNKMEVLNRNIKAIMPNLYAQYHDFFLQNYLQTLEPRVLGLERILPAKSKQEYIAPLTAYVSNVPSLVHGLQFSGQLKLFKTLQPVCNLIIDLDLNIINISMECISMLSLDQKKLSKKKYFITEVIPDFPEKQEEFATKLGAKVICNDFKRKKKYFLATVNISEISFRMVNLQGYIVKIVKLKDLTQEEVDNSPDDLNQLIENQDKEEYAHIRKTQIPYHMQIRLDLNLDSSQIIDPISVDDDMNLPQNQYNKGFIGELQYGPPAFVSKDEHNTSIDNTHLNTQQKEGALDITKINISRLEEQTRMINIEEKDEEDDEIQGFSKGIRTLKLFNERFIDIEDIKRDEEQAIEDLDIINEENFEEQEQNQQQHGQGDDDNYDSQNVFRKKEYFLKFINESQFLNVKSMGNMKLYAIILTILYCGFQIMTHLLIDYQLSEANDRYNLIALQNTQISSCQTILSKMFELYALNLGLYTSITDTSTFISNQKESIKNALQDVVDIQNELQLNTLSLSDKHVELFEEDVVQMQFKNSDNYSFQNFDLNEATQQIINRVNSIVNQDISNFVPNQVDFEFLQFNLLNFFFLAQRDSSDYYVEELDEWANNKTSKFNIILIIAFILVIATMIINLFIYYFVNQSQKEILMFFLDIPVPKIKQLLQKCENFVNQMQSGNEEELVSDESYRSQEEEDEGFVNQRKRGKDRKHKLSLKNDKKYFMPFVQASIIFMTFQIINYIFSTQISSKFSVYIKEMNYTNYAESYYGFSNNAIKQLILDNEFPVLQQDSYKYVNSSIFEMYDITSGIQKEHSQNIQDHNDIYIKSYEDIIMKDQSCQVLSNESSVSLSNCDTFIDSSFKQGLAVVLPRYIENYRKILTQYEIMYDEQKLPLVDIQKLMNDEKMKEIEQTQYEYLRNLFRYLVQQFQKGIDEEYQNSNQLRISLLIICIILVVVIYLFQWVPVLQLISREVIRIRFMITMIPLDICASTPTIRNLVTKYQTTTYKKD